MDTYKAVSVSDPYKNDKSIQEVAAFSTSSALSQSRPVGLTWNYRIFLHSVENEGFSLIHILREINFREFDHFRSSEFCQCGRF